MARKDNLKNWATVKKKWYKRYLPDADGNYICWLCKQPVHISVVTLDHVLTVEEYPEYSKELSNIRPAHKFCNENRDKEYMLKTKRMLRMMKRKK